MQVSSKNHRTVYLFSIYTGQQVDLLVAQSREGGYERKTLIPPKKNRDINSVITSVVPGDFDGDVQMDVLVTRKVIGVDNSPVSVDIYWGNSSAISVSRTFLCYIVCIITCISLFSDVGFNNKISVNYTFIRLSCAYD